MKSLLPALWAVLFSSAAFSAEGTRTLIFQDNFERSESQELKDEPGNGWTTSSDTRAGGNKQVDLKDGAMHISMHETGDHAVSVRHEFAFQNGAVELRFLLEDPDDTLTLNFADMECKEVHAGHLFKVTVGTTGLAITDQKTGIMNQKIRALRKSNAVPPAIAKELKSKTHRCQLKLKPGKWYSLATEVSGDTIKVMIDGKNAGTFSSPGFAHPTKRLLRLLVPRKASLDDLKIYSTATE